jgi:hypothetical protein
MRVRGLTPPPDLPVADARIPGSAVRAGVAIAGGLLCVVDFGASGWLVPGIALALTAAVAPQYLMGWALMLFLAAGELAHHPALTVRFLVLVAGLHLLHVLTMLTLEVPWRSWVQAGVFAGPLRRFAVIEIPTQLLAVIALLLLAPGHDGHRPVTLAGIVLIGAAALAGIGVVLLRPLAAAR